MGIRELDPTSGFGAGFGVASTGFWVGSGLLRFRISCYKPEKPTIYWIQRAKCIPRKILNVGSAFSHCFCFSNRFYYVKHAVCMQIKAIKIIHLRGTECCMTCLSLTRIPCSFWSGSGIKRWIFWFESVIRMKNGDRMRVHKLIILCESNSIFDPLHTCTRCCNYFDESPFFSLLRHAHQGLHLRSTKFLRSFRCVSWKSPDMLDAWAGNFCKLVILRKNMSKTQSHC